MSPGKTVCEKLNMSRLPVPSPVAVKEIGLPLTESPTTFVHSGGVRPTGGGSMNSCQSVQGTVPALTSVSMISIVAIPTTFWFGSPIDLFHGGPTGFRTTGTGLAELPINTTGPGSTLWIVNNGDDTP